MTAKIHHYGPWQIPYKATDVLCSDGKRRTVKLHREADTWFSIPGSVQVKGKTVTGYVTGIEGENGERDLEFRAYLYRKNHSVLPESK